MTYLNAPVNKRIYLYITTHIDQLAKVNKEHAVKSCGDPREGNIPSMHGSRGDSGDPDPPPQSRTPPPLRKIQTYRGMIIHLGNYQKYAWARTPFTWHTKLSSDPLYLSGVPIMSKNLIKHYSFYPHHSLPTYPGLGL